jgi:hypothetical protein
MSVYRGTHDDILVSQIWDSPKIEGQVPIFISSWDRVALLYPLSLSVSLSLMLRPMVSQPVCLGIKHRSWTYDQILITVRQLQVCWCGVLSLTRGRVSRLQLLLVFASAVILGSESRNSRPYFTLSDSRLPFSSPPMTRRATVMVFDPDSTRDSFTPRHLLVLIWTWNGPHRKQRFQKFLCCCLVILYWGKFFAVSLPSNRSLFWVCYSSFHLSCLSIFQHYSIIPNLFIQEYTSIRKINVTKHILFRRSQWPRGLRHKMSSPARTLGSWFRILFGHGCFLYVYSVFVLSCVCVCVCVCVCLVMCCSHVQGVLRNV